VEPSQAYDSDDLKLFVRGLNYDTTEDTLREVFGRYVIFGGGGARGE
jgi:RNA recognition motif-containing protein